MALTKITGQVINDTTGLVVGVTTVGGGVSATDGFFSGIVTAVGDASFSGNVSVGGTLTYEDVTNIDAVGLVTARNGIVVGSGITLSKDGDVFFTGIATGDGSGLTALNASNLASGTVPSARLGSGTASSSTFLAGDSTFKTVTGTTINTNADNRVITGSDTANTLNGESNLTFNGTNLLTVHVPSATGEPAINFTNSDTGTGTSNGFGIGINDSESPYIYNRENTDIRIATNNTERFRIGSSGQFGIGGATYGSSGQVLTSQGSSSAPQWATPASATSGTYTSFGTGYYVDITTTSTNIVKYDILFTGVSCGGGTDWQFQLGDSGGIENSGYEVVACYRSHNTSNQTNNRSDGFRWHGTGSDGFIMDGKFSLTRIHNNKWFGEGQLVRTEAGSTLYDMWGTKELSGALTTIHISASSDDSEVFDGGHFKVIEYTGTV